jgi:DNA repair protein SbcD/Mre11
MKILHCADLHLSRSDRAYSLSVLDEIIAVAAREKADLLLIVGDCFDSWQDAEEMRGDFRDRIAGLPESTPVILVPGNHEILRAPSASAFERFDLGRARVPSSLPFEAIALGPDAELLALPHRESYADYRDWIVPEKKAAFRIVALHAAVAGLNFLGPSEESDAGVVDPDLFARLGADYAALGHIHLFAVKRSGATVLAYPGSARVWRSGEEGQRRVLLLETGTAAVREIPLASAGEFRRVRLALAPDGSLPSLSRLAGFKPADWVRVELSGAVEDERRLPAAEAEICAAIGGSVRFVDFDRDGVVVVEGVSTNRLAARFLENWEKLRPDSGLESDLEAWRRARVVGLVKIKETLESRK